MNGRLAFALSLCVALLVACGGGGGGGAPTLPATPKAQTGTVAFKIGVPAPPANASAKLLKRFNAALATNGIIITAYAHADTSHTTPLVITGADISSSSASCVAAGGGRNCTVIAGAPPGVDDFVISTYDAVPTGSGSSTSDSGHLLAVGSVPNVTVTLGASPTPGTNYINVTLSGVIASVRLSLASPFLHDLIPATTTASVYGLDAGGNVILGNYVDSSGNSATISLAFDNTINNYLTLSSSSISSAPAAGISVTWAGGGIGYPGNDITANLNATLFGSVAATTPITIKYPKFISHSDSNLATQNTFSGAVYNASAKQVYYSYIAGTSGIGVYDVASGSISDYSSGVAGSGGVVLDGANNAYTADATQVTKYPVPAAPQPQPCPTSSGCSTYGAGSGVAYDTSRNAIWFGNGTTLVRFDLTGGQQYFTFNAGANVAAGLAVDNLGNVWIAPQSSGNAIEYFDGSAFHNVALPYGNSKAFDIIFDPLSSSIYVSDPSAGQIEFFNVTAIPASLSASNAVSSGFGTIGYIAVDPIYDNVVWFTYMDNTNLGIGRFDTITGKVTQADDYNANFGKAGNIAPASNGNIYMVHDGGSELLEIQP